MIGIVDYGLGNIKAFLNVYNRLNIPAKIVIKPNDLIDISKIVLPGVGAFDHAMTQLNQSGLRDDLERLVFKYSIPVIGICVGMQMLAENSDEGELPGLGWIKGCVKKFDVDFIPYKTKLPHMGWNTIKILNNNELFSGFNSEEKFYFLHSFYFDALNSNNVITSTTYGKEFASSVANKNIYGVQFHPEKSHNNGVNLLKNFASIC